MLVDMPNIAVGFQNSPRYVKLRQGTSMTKKERRQHLIRIGAIGGHARAAKLSAEELSAIGRKAGLASAAGRLKKIPVRKRRQFARKAARVRWASLKIPVTS